jgi:hypothetical protein
LDGFLFFKNSSLLIGNMNVLDWSSLLYIPGLGVVDALGLLWPDKYLIL